MQHVIGHLRGSVSDDGKSILASLDRMEIRDGARPKTAESFGADRDVLMEINKRVPGSTFETLVRPGAGVALMISDISVFLKDGDDDFLDQTRKRFTDYEHGETMGPTALLGPVRDFNYGFHQDVCAGIVEVLDLKAAALNEMIEMGFYKADGWAGFKLPDSLKKYQGLVDSALCKEWHSIAPDFPKRYEVEFELFENMPDKINDIPCIISTEPYCGSVEIILIGKVDLSGYGWKVMDTEHHNGRPLRRTPMLATSRVATILCLDEAMSPFKMALDPIQIALGPDGFDRRVFQTILTPNLASKYANNKTISVLKHLRWMR